VDRQFQCGARGIERRVALELGICVTLAPGLAFAQTDPARERPREGDLLVAVGAQAPEPLTVDMVPENKPTMAWPMDPESSTVRSGSRLNKVLLPPRPRGFRFRNQRPCSRGDSRLFGGLYAHRVRCRKLASGSPVA
jgi:hypothetical protein